MRVSRSKTTMQARGHAVRGWMLTAAPRSAAVAQALRSTAILRLQRHRSGAVARVTLLLAALLLTLGARALAAPSLELYGTFNAMGVIVTVSPDADPDSDATAVVEYRRPGASAWRRAFPPSRVDGQRFVGSLFWLDPGTSYEVRVTFSDPDGGPLAGQAAEATAATRSEIVVPAATRSLIVTPGGAGTSCSVPDPCALGEALDQAQPGNHVLLREGTYYEGEFELPRSGTAGAPIVIRSYPGEHAVLDGSDPGGFIWSPRGGGVYRTTLRGASPHLVTANGARLFPYESAADLQALRWGIGGFQVGGSTLDVHLAGDIDPNAAAMVVSRYAFAFLVEHDFVYFVDLTFRHYGAQDYAKAIYLYGASDNLVQECTFVGNDIGVALKYASHRNVIQDNEFRDSIGSWPWEAVKSAGSLEDGGVEVYDPMTGRGTVIRRNRFHDDFDGLHVCPWDGATTNEMDVYDNLVYDVADDGMETDGYCSNVRIWGNTFHDVLMGVSLAPAYTGPVYVIRNLVYRTGAGGRAGSGFKFNSGYDQSGPMFLLHNTVDATRSDQDALYLASPGSWSRLYARNNIFSGTSHAITNENASQPVDLDYDDLSVSGPGPLAWWDGLPDGHLATLEELRSATGQEVHGLAVVPGFADAGGGDYVPASGSPLVDAGLVLPGINDDFAGAGPDIGAFESGGDTGLDLDGDSLPDGWETRFGLDPAAGTGDNGPDGDPDDDGRTNVQEYQGGTHPRGFHTRYFAEGATSDFFKTTVALMNTSPVRAHVQLRFLRGDGSARTHTRAVGANTRATLDVSSVSDMARAEFSTVIESDEDVVIDRTMTWDQSGYGSHAETSIAAPAATWYLAEGATHAGFNLFYLVQNPNDQPVTVQVTYLFPVPKPPIVRTYPVPPNSRFNIWVDTEGPDLENTDVSATFSSPLPIIVERAMYLDRPGQVFGAGHESAAVAAPASEWFLAEGATGDFFDLFVLLANPAERSASVTATFLLPDGGTIARSYTLAPKSRFNIWVDTVDPRLANTAVSTIVTSTNGVPIIVERAMWWPGPTAATWTEAHNSAGLTSTGRKWALAEGEVGGSRSTETYILIANRGAADTARVTLFYEDGTSESKDVPLAASSRTNVAVAFDFPNSAGRRFGATIEALGATPQIVVERAAYSNAGGTTWAAGSNAVATRLR